MGKEAKNITADAYPNTLRSLNANLGVPVNVKHFGAVGDGVTDDTAAINAAIATGLNIYFPETENSYYITGALTPFVRYQSAIGNGLTTIKVDRTTDYHVFTLSVDNLLKNIIIEGVNGTSDNGIGVLLSSGTKSTDFSSTCVIDNCWMFGFKYGIQFHNSFSISIKNCQIRNCKYGAYFNFDPTDDPNGEYFAAINFYSTRFYAQSVNDIYVNTSGTSRCRGINFYGCTFDPMGDGTESIKLINAALVHFDGCYMEATTIGASGQKQIVADGSVFLSINSCVFSGTGGIDLVASVMDITNSWSFSPVSPANDKDPIIADSLSIVTIKNSTFRSTAHSFLTTASRVSLKDATIRISGIVNYIEDNHYELGIPYEESGTFSPTYAPTTGSFTEITYSAQEGQYEKVGKLLYISGALRTSTLDTTGASGNLKLHLNLPSGYVQRSGASAIVVLTLVGTYGTWASTPNSGVVNSTTDDINLAIRPTANESDAVATVAAMNTGVGSYNFVRFSGIIQLD